MKQTRLCRPPRVAVPTLAHAFLLLCLAGVPSTAADVVLSSRDMPSFLEDRECLTRPAVSVDGSLSDRGIDLYVDGMLRLEDDEKAASSSRSTRFEVTAGIAHELELVVTTTTTTLPFDAAWIRAKSFSTDFSLLPWIHAQVDPSCNTTIGTTTTSKEEDERGVVLHGVMTPKGRRPNINNYHVMSASFTAVSFGDIVWDIFVMDYDDSDSDTINTVATRTWHSRIVVTSVDWSLQDVVVAPTPEAPVLNIAQTKASSSKAKILPVEIQSTHSPIVTPTTPAKSPFQTDRNGKKILNYQYPVCCICGEGRQISRTNHTIHLLHKEKQHASCHDLERDGLLGLMPADICSISRTVAEHECACVAVESAQFAMLAKASRTVPSPTIVVATPPFSKPTSPCYVCGVNGRVTNGDAIVAVGESTGTCLDLQHDGESGFISSFAVCQTAVEVALAKCGCAIVSDTITKIENEPTRSPAPTQTASPSYAEKCNVCGPNRIATALHEPVLVHGRIGTCQELEMQGILGFIIPSLCDEAQAAATEKCACASDPAITTFTPTVTPFPTTSNSPSFSDKCHVCGYGNQVSKWNAVLVVDELAMTCQELQETGEKGWIPPNLCQTATLTAQASCGCVPGRR